MLPLSTLRWRLVSIQEASCCIDKMPKQSRQYILDCMITKFVWQLGWCEPSSLSTKELHGLWLRPILYNTIRLIMFSTLSYAIWTVKWKKHFVPQNMLECVSFQSVVLPSSSVRSFYLLVKYILSLIAGLVKWSLLATFLLCRNCKTCFLSSSILLSTIESKFFNLQCRRRRRRRCRRCSRRCRRKRRRRETWLERHLEGSNFLLRGDFFQSLFTRPLSLSPCHNHTNAVKE